MKTKKAIFLGVTFLLMVSFLLSVSCNTKEDEMQTELLAVQTAMMAVMAANDITLVDAQATAVGDLSGLPTANRSALAQDFDDMLTKTDTKYCYTWTSDGTVSLAECP